MEKLLWLLQQRRFWSALVGVSTMMLTLLHAQYQFDVPAVTEALTAFGGAASIAISSVLALWSLLRPKKGTNPLPK